MGPFLFLGALEKEAKYQLCLGIVMIKTPFSS